MNNRHKKLTADEAKSLARFIKSHGSQKVAARVLGITEGTLNRTANGHTGPSPLLRDKLVEQKIIKEAEAVAA